MRMRASETFQVITEDLMADITRVTDTVQQPLMKRPRTGKGFDSQHKGKGKGYQQRWSPPGQGRRYRSSTLRPWQPSPLQWQAQQPMTWSPRRLGNPRQRLPSHLRCLLRQCPSTPLQPSHRRTHGTRRATRVPKVLARKASSTKGARNRDSTAQRPRILEPTIE